MASKFNVLLYEAMHSCGTELLKQHCNVTYAKSFKEEDIIPQVADVDAIIIRANGAISASIIAAAPKLKVIGRHGVGLDAIDLQAAKARGIPVVYTPTANTESVAEHFAAIALMLAKKARLGDVALRAGQWDARYKLIGTELFGKTLGVLGFGRIGQQTARICHQGFGMRVIYYDAINYPEAEARYKAKRVSKETVFSDADFISVNLPFLPQTRHFVNAELIKLMKPTAFLINMARGVIWKEDDVIAALQEKRIAGVGADVYENEPIGGDHPFCSMDTFVGTPHMSAHSEEAMIKMSLVAKDVLAVLEGREPEFPVNL
ncbi:MAG: hydroxyacid dehydrogenase [Desulfobacteraceae bacterium]|nr:hydroxyacid dehydrogenase [Desulfobacteraceae bacterium]